MKALYNSFANLFVLLGGCFLISPLLLYRFIHSDYDRYIWVINGPYLFSHLGSDPFQILAGVLFLSITVLFLVTGLLFRISVKNVELD